MNMKMEECRWSDDWQGKWIPDRTGRRKRRGRWGQQDESDADKTKSGKACQTNERTKEDVSFLFG